MISECGKLVWVKKWSLQNTNLKQEELCKGVSFRPRSKLTGPCGPNLPQM